MRSETFIGRHMTDLLPGQTTAIGRLRRPTGPQPDWVPEGPILDLARGLSGGRELWWRASRFAVRRAGLRPDALSVGRFLRRRGVEVLLAEYVHTSPRWLPVAHRLGLRFVAHAHGVDASAHLREPAWPDTRRALHSADAVIVVSEAMRERLVNGGIDSARLHVIPYGVDVPETPPSRTQGRAVTCLAVGRMVPKKGPVYLLESFVRAVRDVPQLRLELVGDGELLAAVRRFVSEHDLGDRVTLHGSLPHPAVQRLMLEADVFLQHSLEDPETGDAEGLPVAILEAMASALPVVATRHEGIAEAIPDETVGLLVAERDTEEMAARIVELAADSQARTRIGDAAWRHARERFTWERERSDLLELLGLA